jgi:hypothetical protein
VYVSTLHWIEPVSVLTVEHARTKRTPEHAGRQLVTEHHLPATPETTVDVFDRDTPPVLTVDPGDSIVVSSLDAA